MSWVVLWPVNVLKLRCCHGRLNIYTTGPTLLSQDSWRQYAKFCTLVRYHLAPIAGLAYFALVQTQLSSIYSKVEMSFLGLCFGL